jgi:UDP-N-acetylmuramoyl-tripeptide--D-alanyl-D-alanine ligase
VLPLTLGEIASACGGTLEAGAPETVVERVCTDTRRLAPGDLFVGLRGENFDGDAYAAAALAAGAAALVVGSTAAAGLPPAAPRIVVADGLAALQRLASYVRRHTAARIVAITGSAGKTSTKDILAALLRPVARTVATSANLNNEIGVPLTLLEIDERTEVAVVEMAMRGAGQIRELAQIATPDIGVITTIAPVHLELVGTIADVAAAKAELIEELGGGTAVVPVGETLLDRHVGRHPGRVVTFGGPDADVHIVDEERRGASTHVLVDAFGHRGTIDFSFTGGHYLQDALAALAAFLELGYRLDEAREGAAQVAFSDLRGAVSELPGGGLLLNDAYNANPAAMKAAIDHLVSIADGRPVVAVLGDMYELGPGADAFHRAVGEHCAAAGVRLVAVGDLARDFLAGAAGEHWFATVDECIAALPEIIPAGSAVLVKASRLLRLARVAEALAKAGAGDAAGEGRDA